MPVRNYIFGKTFCISTRKTKNCTRQNAMGCWDHSLYDTTLPAPFSRALKDSLPGGRDGVWKHAGKGTLSVVSVSPHSVWTPVQASRGGVVGERGLTTKDDATACCNPSSATEGRAAPCGNQAPFLPAEGRRKHTAYENSVTKEKPRNPAMLSYVTAVALTRMCNRRHAKRTSPYKKTGISTTPRICIHDTLSALENRIPSLPRCTSLPVSGDVHRLLP